MTTGMTLAMITRKTTPRNTPRSTGAELEAALAALAIMSVAELKTRWITLSGSPAPNLPAPLLRRLVAQQMQEQQHGGLTPRTRRALERATGGKGAPPAAAGPAPGTRLIRDWNGQTIAVEVRDGSYVWEGRSYRSLSQIAREVTGARWSGPRFFGLRRGDG